MKLSTLLLALVPFLLTSELFANDKAVVAKINGKTIRLKEFNKIYQENLRYFQFKKPSRRDVLDDMVKRELGIQEAKKLGLHKNPEVIQRMNTALYQALLDRKLRKKTENIFIEEAEAKRYFQQSPEIRTSHIFVPVAAGASKAEVNSAREKITDIQKKLKGNASFAEVAQRNSEDPSAAVGGDMDYRFRNQLDPTYYRAARRLKVGAVSGVVKTKLGFHLIKLTGVRKWKDADRPKVKRIIFEEKRQKLFEDYMASLRKKSKVIVNYKNL